MKPENRLLEEHIQCFENDHFQVPNEFLHILLQIDNPTFDRFPTLKHSQVFLQLGNFFMFGSCPTFFPGTLVHWWKGGQEDDFGGHGTCYC